MAVAESSEPAPQGPWETVKFTADKAAETVAIEKEILDIFERRHTIARRLADAYVRKDDQMAAKSATDWIRSEIALHNVFERYQKHVMDRNAIVQAVNADAPSPPSP